MDHGGCSLLVGVDDAGIVKIKGDPEGFLNKGFVCPKGFATAEKLKHPNRLKHPLKRMGGRGEGKWEKIRWDEALDEIRDHFLKIKDEFGAKAVAFCQGMPKGLEHFVLIRLANIFGSPNLVAVQDVCHAPREVTGIHTCGFYPVVDFHHPTSLAVLWGSNIMATNEEGVIGSQLMERLREGAELMVIDPIKTAMAKRAKLFLQIKPGTDHALALAFLNVIIEEKLYDETFVAEWTHGFDALAETVRRYPPGKMSRITGVSESMIIEGARLYATAKPAALAWGNPLEQQIFTFDTLRAMVCLMAICGNLDAPGGNIKANEPKIMRLGEFVRADLIPNKRKEMIHASHHTIPGLMTVPPAFFRKAVLEEYPYPVKGAYMQCCNPMLSYADSRQTYDALMKLDFFAVADIFMTPTANLADIVLPAATQFEFNDLGHYGLGHGFIVARPKIVEPPAECRPDMKILNALGKRLSPEEYWPEDSEQFLEDVVAPAGMNYRQFVEKGYLKGNDRFHKYRDKGFKTPTGKVELSLSKADKFNLPELPGFTELPEAESEPFPLILTSAKSPYFLHSSYRWMDKLRQAEPGPVVKIHPETADKYGIQDEKEVVIETESGEITQKAKITENILPGIVCAAYGWWFPEIQVENGFNWNQSNYNMLTRTDRLGKEFGTPNLKGLRCRIRAK